MREVVAVCESNKAARVRVERVLDRYLWRIGERTWRGKASSACLERMAADLRKKASRATAVAVHEVKRGSHHREPLFTIGRKGAFGGRGIVPVSSSPSQARAASLPAPMETARAVLALAAAFHDMGKAGRIFQGKIRAAMAGGQPIADSARHELISALIWDVLFGRLDDVSLGPAVAALMPEDVDAAWLEIARSGGRMARIRESPDRDMSGRIDFLSRGGGLTRAVGMLILTHHRLPGSGTTGLSAGQHVRKDLELSLNMIAPAEGDPFWREEGWIARVRAAGSKLSDTSIGMFDLTLRTCLMTADHLGSARKTASETAPAHVANTIRISGQPAQWGDSLATHTSRVMAASRAAFDALVLRRDHWPSIPREAVPDALLDLTGSTGRFAWQADAAAAAAEVASSGGGFFACVMAGTGTGKTRGVPAILSAAAMADPDPARQKLRFNLCLGLRTLASQSARSYIEDLGFDREDVSVALGRPPIEVPEQPSEKVPLHDVSEPSQLQEALADTEVLYGEEIAEPPSETEHLRRLSWSPEDELHPFIRDLMAEAGIASRERFFASPILVGTIDQLAPSIMPARSRHLPAAIRIMTSDLIVDEIDQLGPEDVAALCRLMRQAGAAGRRVVIASATVPREVAVAAFSSYRSGWADHAAFSGAPCHVSSLFCGDGPAAVVAELDCTDPAEAFRRCAERQCSAPAHGGRIPAILEVPEEGGRWEAVSSAVSECCDELHAQHAATIDGIRVSMGFIRLSRIAHAVAMAHQLCRLNPRSGIHRRVICLHSRMTGAMRGFIETEIRSALTRKGSCPDDGLRKVLSRHGIDRDARAEGAADIEIVVVCTPVIETGNDVDFDWAILDPSDARSVIQAAGRVRRHRIGSVNSPNIMILACPLVVMETGKLRNPGLETRLNQETLVTPPDLGETRDDSRLFLGTLSQSISARPILLRQEGACPAADKEAALREDFLNGAAPLAAFNNDPICRSGLGRLSRRQFRRRDLPDTTIIRDEGSGHWRLDQWSRFGEMHVACRSGTLPPAPAAFADPEGAARQRYEALGASLPKGLSTVSIPVTADAATTTTEIQDDPFFGILLEGQDPAAPFGKGS